MDFSVATESGISLREHLDGASFYGVEDVRVTSICNDSRRVREGDLFVAITGVRHDGHEHWQEAVRRGAVAILAEQPLPAGGVPVCIVPDSRAAHGRLCQALSGNPSHQLRVLGITGTNGKTSTAMLLRSVLNEAGFGAGVLGTLGYFDGYDAAEATHTTPPAPVLAKWLARTAAQGCSHAVLEVSSHALSQSRIAGVRLDAAMITNVGRDHLDYHNSQANYRDAKARILDHLSPDGVVILNTDDPFCSRLICETYHPTLTVSMKKEAELTATLVERHFGEQTFLLNAGLDTVPVRTRTIGDHFIYNCLGAAAMGLVYGISLQDIVRGIEAVNYVPGRMEPVVCGQPFGVVIDYAHTPDALVACLKALRTVTAGRVICVFGAGGDRDRQKRPQMGTVVERLADLAVITSDNPRSEDPRVIAENVRRGFSSPATAKIVTDRAAAIAFALREARAGDCVVIAGKGHESYQVVGNHRYEFDDRTVANHVLQRMYRATSLAA